ncbi:MAG: hypothetical protein ABIX36_10995 [Mucilaginibacter sp.]|uniref:hypothetical protein n=1 Tax=Mucilaginibacter sp. TaxID=1882438 RepID=UPI0032656A04
MNLIPFKINYVENSNKPELELVRFIASVDINTSGYALIDKTFDGDEKVSNEFRHIYIFPDLEVKKGQEVLLYTGKGTNGFFKFNNSNVEYHRLFWGANECVWNDKGGDKATLIKFDPINSVSVPKVS